MNEKPVCHMCSHNNVRNLHPEDAALERNAKREARAGIARFFRRHGAKFKALVSTYADRQAESKLGELRELFWAATPAGAPPKRKRKKQRRSRRAR